MINGSAKIQNHNFNSPSAGDSSIHTLSRVLAITQRGLFITALLIAVFPPFALGKDKPIAGGGLKASWYSIESLAKEGTTKFSKNIMANGKPFDENALTCATRLYPLGAEIIVTNLKNKKSIKVKVTDRIGKRFAKTRVDLSKGAFERIASLKEGLLPIEVKEVRR